jgi:MGT family glycosyltransferase
MSRILFTTMPMAGHLRPGLPLAAELVAGGHEVGWYCGAKYAALVDRTGARVFPMSADRDFDDAQFSDEAHSGEKPGLGTLKRGIMDLFIAPVAGWVDEIDAVLDDFAPDVVVAEQGFMAGPLAAERRGVPSVVFSVSPLGLSSVDTAPFGTGLLPSSSPLGRVRNRCLNWTIRSVVFAAAQRAAEQTRARLGLPPLDAYFMDWGVEVADRFLVPSVPEFEYPRRDLPANVEFVGAFVPRGVDTFTPPAWWPDVLEASRAGRPIVLVTQGTLATEPSNLVLPAVAGLADVDALVVATVVGHDPDQVLPPADRPANLRLTGFLPFDRLLPMVDVMVTNGGYGGVQMALGHGVPLVVAGLTEDKMEVSSRVTWSGTGVALRTDTPTPRQVRDGVATVLGSPSYRARATELATAYTALPGVPRAAEVVLEVAARHAAVG